MTDVWDWIHASMQGFRDNRDRARYGMGMLFYSGMQLMREDPQRALILFTEAKTAAEVLEEPWWVVLCNHWTCQTLLEKTRNVAAAAKLANELICATASSTVYEGLPQLVCLHDDRAGAMLGMDPLGYAAEIEADCQIIDTRGADQPSCLHCSRGTRVLASLAKGDVATAEASAIAGLKLCNTDGASHYLPIYYCALCAVAVKSKDWVRLAHWAKAGVLFHGKMGTEAGNIELLMWHALATLKLNDCTASRTAYRKARKAGKAAHFKLTHGYFDALALYHEERGHVKLSLAARQMQLDNTSGAPYLECLSRLERVRLLKSCALPIEIEVANLNLAASLLREPSRICERLSEITAG